MERCAHKYVSQYPIEHSIITVYQSGFTPGGSTVNQLVFLCCAALDQNNEIMVLLLDLSKAFDKVWHKGLLAKLRAIGFSDNIVDWFSSYLNNRKQRICIGRQTSSWQTLNAGIPQGSILESSFIFNIYQRHCRTYTNQH